MSAFEDIPDLPAAMVVHHQEAVNAAYTLEARIVTTIRSLRANWVELAGQLYEWHQTCAWATLGYDSLEHWLANPDVEISRSVFFRLVEVYRETVIERGVTPEALGRVDFTKVREVLPAVRRGHIDVGDALADAEVLTRTDLEEKFRPRPLGANLQAEPIRPDDFHYETCKTCGQKVRVSDA